MTFPGALPSCHQCHRLQGGIYSQQFYKLYFVQTSNLAKVDPVTLHTQHGKMKSLGPMRSRNLGLNLNQFDLRCLRGHALQLISNLLQARNQDPSVVEAGQVLA